MVRGVFIAGFVGALISVWVGFCWAEIPFTSQEGTANYAKALDWFRAWWENGDGGWWSGSFQGGTSLAPLWGTLVPSAALMTFVAWFGPEMGIKVAMLACIPLATAGMYGFVRALSGSATAAAFAALSISLAPALWVRVLYVEHVVVVFGTALLPFVFWGFWRAIERPSFLSALVASAAYSLVLLTYSKVAVLLIPALAAFVFWGFWKHCGVAAWLKPHVLIPLLSGVVILGILPNLPALRESGFAALFEFGPMEGWQQSFATKSALQFFDRGGAISMAGFREDFSPSTGRGGYYLGAIPLVALAVALLFRRRFLADPASARLFSLLRLAGGLTLFSYWLSHGPFSVFSANLRALEGSAGAANFWPALLWLVLGIQGWVLWGLLPLSMPLKKAAGIVLLTVYFLVPGFPLIGWLPVFSQIRAPFDFFQIVGAIWVCAAAGMAGALAIGLAKSVKTRGAIAAAALGLWVADFSVHLDWPRERGLPNGTESAFRETANFLRESPDPGKIFAISGRYFYLQLPGLTDRGLVNEAFQSYLQQRDYAALLALAYGALPDFVEFLRIAGVRYVFVDLNDPDLPKDLVEGLRTRLNEAFSNRFFSILEVEDPLAPAFHAEDTVLLSSRDLLDLAIGFEVAGRDFAAIGPVLPGPSVGEIKEGTLEFDSAFDAQRGRAFQSLPQHAVRNPSHHRWEVDLPGRGGWVILPVAWHPDWTAEGPDGLEEIYRGFGAFIALPDTHARTIRLVFNPPPWYAAALTLSGTGWVLTVGLIGLGASPRLGAWFRRYSHPASLNIRREPILRPLAITPTYEEAASVGALIDQVMATESRLELLVVDDASPDGTAAVVRAHPAFGTRVHLLEREGKLGLGSAYREGFRWAGDRGFDACIEIDADLSHNPADVPRLLACLDEGLDAAIGSRYLDGLRVVNWPEHRLLISAFGTQFVRFFTGLPLTDATSGFKALRVAAMNRIDWSGVRADGYGFQVELHYALWRGGARLGEVPITFTERADGKTKMTAAIAWEAMTRVLQLAIQTR